LGLLNSKVITLEQEGNKSTLDGLWVVDEQKLMTLSDVQTLELARAGYLGLVYAHLLSLKCVGHLARRQTARRQAAANALNEHLPDAGGGVVH
jgi:hypothetical protein